MTIKLEPETARDLYAAAALAAMNINPETITPAEMETLAEVAFQMADIMIIKRGGFCA